jgi:hypothetical protein
MFGSLFRLLRPIRIIKRKAILKGLFGGDRKWLALGGIVFVGGRIRSLLGFGDPQPVYIEDLAAGDRVVVAHEEPRRRRSRRS